LPRNFGWLTAIAVAALTAWTIGLSSPRAASGQTLSVQDYMDIEQLYAAYYQSIDAGDAERWSNTFAVDGRFNSITGHDALAEFIRNGTGRGTPLRHWQSNLTLTSTPSGAMGSVYVMQFNVKETPIRAVSYSRYDDTLVKTKQGWRFKSRVRSTDTTLTPGPGAR
jgi:hypothetical protein